jgi:hypothetical protein
VTQLSLVFPQGSVARVPLCQIPAELPLPAGQTCEGVRSAPPATSSLCEPTRSVARCSCSSARGSGATRPNRSTPTPALGPRHRRSQRAPYEARYWVYSLPKIILYCKIDEVTAWCLVYPKCRLLQAPFNVWWLPLPAFSRQRLIRSSTRCRGVPYASRDRRMIADIRLYGVPIGGSVRVVKGSSGFPPKSERTRASKFERSVKARTPVSPPNSRSSVRASDSETRNEIRVPTLPKTASRIVSRSCAVYW